MHPIQTTRLLCISLYLFDSRYFVPFTIEQLLFCSTFKMRLFWPEFILALECLPIGVYSLEFINPPPFAATTDFSLNTIYVEGSILNIEWTAGPAGNNTSLTLWQLNGTQYLQPFEYLTRKSIPCSLLLGCPLS